MDAERDSRDVQAGLWPGPARAQLRMSDMTRASRRHAAPMGLESFLFGIVYYKHVAPTELAAPAQPLFCGGWFV
jgi:hypothetical protein